MDVAGKAPYLCLFWKKVTESNSESFLVPQYVADYMALNVLMSDTENNPQWRIPFVTFDDYDSKIPWQFQYDFFRSSNYLVLREPWCRFLHQKQVKPGDLVVFYRHPIDGSRLSIRFLPIQISGNPFKPVDRRALLAETDSDSDLIPPVTLCCYNSYASLDPGVKPQLESRRYCGDFLYRAVGIITNIFYTTPLGAITEIHRAVIRDYWGFLYHIFHLNLPVMQEWVALAYYENPFDKAAAAAGNAPVDAKQSLEIMEKELRLLQINEA